MQQGLFREARNTPVLRSGPLGHMCFLSPYVKSKILANIGNVAVGGEALLFNHQFSYQKLKKGFGYTNGLSCGLKAAGEYAQHYLIFNFGPKHEQFYMGIIFFLMPDGEPQNIVYRRGKKKPPLGIEPRTISLRSACSTN